MMRTRTWVGNPLLVFTLIAAALLAAETWIARAVDLASRPDVLSLAITADIVVAIPLLYYLIVVRRKGLPAITVAPVFVLSLIAAGRILPPQHHTWLDRAELIVPLVELSVLAFIALNLRKVAGHYRRLRPAHPYFPETLESSLRAALPTFPPLVASLLTTEVSLISFGLTGWVRQAPPATDDRPRFSYHRQGSYAFVLGFLSFLVILETAVAHLLLTQWSPAVAWFLTAGSIYTLIWFFGDYHASRLQPIMLGETQLHLRAGMRWRVDIPWQQVETVRKATAPDRKASDFLNAAIMGEPRLVVVLTEPVSVTGLLGRTKQTAHIGISVDDETTFLGTFSERIHQTSGDE